MASYVEVLHIGAEFGDDAGRVRARRVGQRRLAAMSARANVGVDRVDAGRVNFNLNLVEVSKVGEPLNKLVRHCLKAREDMIILDLHWVQVLARLLAVGKLLGRRIR